MCSFADIAEQYLSERVVSKTYADKVMKVAQHCQRPEEARCNQYLRKRLEEVSSVTVAPERVIILTLWRFAYERRLVDALPRGLIRIKRQLPPTRAWSIEECCTAVKCAAARRGTMRSGAPISAFLRCWLLLGYETGARQQDLWSLSKHDFKDGMVSWTQRKTGVPHYRAISKTCQEAVAAMLALSPDGTVLAWAIGAHAARRTMRVHLRACGLRGSGKWLRRSGATHIEMMQPGKGRIHLGHKTHGMAEKHYIDWSQVGRDMPRTPSLSG